MRGGEDVPAHTGEGGEGYGSLVGGHVLFGDCSTVADPMVSWMLGGSCGGELGCNIPKLHVRFYAQEVFPG